MGCEAMGIRVAFGLTTVFSVCCPGELEMQFTPIGHAWVFQTAEVRSPAAAEASSISSSASAGRCDSRNGSSSGSSMDIVAAAEAAMQDDTNKGPEASTLLLSRTSQYEGLCSNC